MEIKYRAFIRDGVKYYEVTKFKGFPDWLDADDYHVGGKGLKDFAGYLWLCTKTPDGRMDKDEESILHVGKVVKAEEFDRLVAEEIEPALRNIAGGVPYLYKAKWVFKG